MSGDAQGETIGQMIALYSPESALMEDHVCYVFAAQTLPAESWMGCGADPYGGSACRTDGAVDTFETTVPAFRVMPGTMRAIRTLSAGREAAR